MCTTAVCLATILLGIDVQWEPLPEGGVEYRIQIEPELLENLDESGVLVQSDVPPYVGDIRAFRITVGNTELGRSPALNAEEPSDASQVAPADPFLPSPSNPSIPTAPPLPPMRQLKPPGQPNGMWPPPQDSVGTQPEDPPDTQSETSGNPPAMPGPFPDDPISRPIGVRQAIHVESIEPESPAAVKTTPAQPQTPAKPWGTLIATSFALFASFGLNLYLGWIAVDFRRRCRTLAGDLGANAPID
ncbi:MAG: hypothetical protein V3R99_12190 [Thermoguttaceae bacterium]